MQAVVRNIIYHNNANVSSDWIAGGWHAGRICVVTYDALQPMKKLCDTQYLHAGTHNKINCQIARLVL